MLKRLKIPSNEREAAIADFQSFLAEKDAIIVATGFAGNKNLIRYLKMCAPEVRSVSPAVIENALPANPEYEGFRSSNFSKILPSFSEHEIKQFMEKIIPRRYSSYDGIIYIPTFTYRLFELLQKSDKRIVANNFALSFLFVHRKSFITHSFTKQEADETGTKKSIQRFEQCIAILESNMQPAMHAIFARRYVNEETKKAAEELVMNAIADVIAATERTDLIPEVSIKEFSWRLQHMDPIVMFMDDVLNQTFIENIYEDLKLENSQPLFKMISILKDFHKRIVKTEWFTKFEDCCNKDDISSEHTTVSYTRLYVPAKFTLYPYFHPKRPKFFNMATLYDRTVFKLSKAIVESLLADYRISNGVSYSDIYDLTSIAFSRYDSWLNAGNQDLELSAFKLNSRQMYWLALAHRYVLKFHKNVPEKFMKQDRLESNYLHVRFKNRTIFRQVFECDEMNDMEKLKLKEFTEREDQNANYYIRCDIQVNGFPGSCVGGARRPYPIRDVSESVKRDKRDVKSDGNKTSDVPYKC